MKITKPEYYDTFRCIAGACPDSCCKEWDVQVDAESAAYYRGLPGDLGDVLRRSLQEEDGQIFLSIQDGRCPLWRQDGLCRIHAELGEEALCHVCHRFPRLRHDYGDFVELGLELSCPEAARLILGQQQGKITEETETVGVCDYDREAMASLKATRQTALALVSRPDISPAKALSLLLFYGCQAQDELDGGEREEFDPEEAAENAAQLAKSGDLRAIQDFFLQLELLTPRWEALLRAEHTASVPAQTRALARYLIDRYWLQAIVDYDLVGRVKFIVLICLLVGSLGGDYTQTATLFSKEIENDVDNVDAILDAIYSTPAFADDRLLGLLSEADRLPV